MSEQSYADIEDLHGLGICVGRVLHAEVNPKARKPAYILRIDFGELGHRTSSAQLTENYSAESLVGRLVVAATNLPPKRVAGIVSEVLVLGAICPTRGTILLNVDSDVTLGSAVS